MIDKTLNFKSDKESISVLDWVKRIEPKLLDDFVKYWSIRKTPFFLASSLIDEIKTTDSNAWIRLIKSNHQFRAEYGEEKANELINIIEISKPVLS